MDPTITILVIVRSIVGSMLGGRAGAELKPGFCAVGAVVQFSSSFLSLLGFTGDALT